MRRLVYDNWDHLIRVRYFDRNDKPVMIRQGYATVFWEYDLFGRIEKEKYLDVNDFSVVLADGTAWAGYEYDEAGQLKEIVHYDARGNRIGQGSAAGNQEQTDL